MATGSRKFSGTRLLNQSQNGYLIGSVTERVKPLVFYLFPLFAMQVFDKTLCFHNFVKEPPGMFAVQSGAVRYCLENDAPKLLIILLCAYMGPHPPGNCNIYAATDKSGKKLNSPTVEYSGQIGQWIGINKGHGIPFQDPRTCR
jgi:hypothetical protein